MENTTTDQKILLTKKGMKDLRKKISQLEHERSQTIQALREGDRKFDHDGRLKHIEQVSAIESLDDDIRDKKLILEHATLVSSKRQRNKVDIGSVVDLIDEKNQLRRFIIVNSFEANPSRGRISNLSPLGHNLIGKTVRDIIEYHHGNVTRMWKLVRIS